MPTFILEHSDHARSDRIGAILSHHGHRIEVRRLHRGEPVPHDLEGVDAIVALGGPQSPDDDGQPFMAAELALMRAAHAAEVPMLGICLGCQLLARALGGTVERNGRIEWGFHEVTLAPPGRDDPLFAGIPWRTMQMHAHRWHVTKTPPGARTLAKSALTPVQAWALGPYTYAVQYHLESWRETLEAWSTRTDPKDREEAGLDAATFARDLDAHYPAFARLADRFVENAALLLLPVDRRHRGLVKALHH